MAELRLVYLDDDDLKCVNKIMKNVKDVSTLQDAVKWALKQVS
jgi:hypothetical protein